MGKLLLCPGPTVCPRCIRRAADEAEKIRRAYLKWLRRAYEREANALRRSARRKRLTHDERVALMLRAIDVRYAGILRVTEAAAGPVPDWFATVWRSRRLG